MSVDQIEQLNADFAIAEDLEFVAGPGGLIFAAISNTLAVARIALQGAQIVEFQPHGQAPVLWVSRQSNYLSGKSIRGGIPVCWPWFAAHPSDPSKPFHGFARTRLWSVQGSAARPDGSTELRLELIPDEETRAIWPHEFILELVVVVGASLHVSLIAQNVGVAPFVCGGALHSYFHTGAITATLVQGLDGARYVDKVDEGRTKTQRGAVTVEGEVDRVYLDTTAPCSIDDPTLGRRIVIEKAGSRSTVVWNPGPAKAQEMADMEDEEYHEMLCVETANALDDAVTLAPGDEHRLEANISVKR